MVISCGTISVCQPRMGHKSSPVKLRSSERRSLCVSSSQCLYPTNSSLATTVSASLLVKIYCKHVGANFLRGKGKLCRLGICTPIESHAAPYIWPACNCTLRWICFPLFHPFTFLFYIISVPWPPHPSIQIEWLAEKVQWSKYLSLIASSLIYSFPTASHPE